MFICTEVTQSGSCTVFDTMDFVSEKLSIDILAKALKDGISVKGCELVNGELQFDKSDFRVSNYSGRIYMSKGINYQGEWVSIAIPNKSTPDHYRYSVYRKGCDNEVFHVIVRNNNSYSICVDKESEYNGKPLLFCVISYYDKHYYAEDRGESMGLGIVVYNGKVLGRSSSFVPMTDIYEYPTDEEIMSGKFQFDCVSYNLRGN